jgi:DNA-binding CsgD family transcriptional regulator
LRVLRDKVGLSAETQNGAGGQPPRQSELRPAAILSDRELEVLALLVKGLTMKQVARELGITARTVAFHKYRAMEMNGLRNNADLMEFAVRNGILAPWSQPRS